MKKKNILIKNKNLYAAYVKMEIILPPRRTVTSAEEKYPEDEK
jgi:hypothetical protein